MQIKTHPSIGNGLALIMEAWKHAPHKAISLWDMKEFYANYLIAITEFLEREHQKAEAAAAQNPGQAATKYS